MADRRVMERERQTARTEAQRERRLQKHRERLKDANFSSAIYGEILLLSVLAAVDGSHANARVVLETVLSSQLVFWLAHAYSETVEAQLKAQDEGIGLRGVARVMEHEWPLVQAAGPTVVLMVLSLLGAMSARTAIDISFVIAVISLVGWGFAASGRSGRPLVARLLVGALSGAFGLGIVALKLLIHH